MAIRKSSMPGWTVCGLIALGLLISGSALPDAFAYQWQRTYFGIKVLEVDTLVAQRLGVQQSRGVLVTVVRTGSPGEQAGLLPGDVIVRFGGVDTPRIEVLQRLMGQAMIGTRYRAEFYRGSKYLFANIVAAEPPPPQEVPQTFDLGMSVVPAGTPEAVRLQVESPVGAVVTRIRPGGPAEQAGLRAGDLILEFAGRPTETVEDYQAVAFLCPLESRQPVTFVRGHNRLATTITIAPTPRIEPPWHYVHPDDSFRVQMPPLWYVFPVDQPEVAYERQYTRIISPYAAYELKCFKGAWPAGDAEQALAAFVQKNLSEGPNRQSGRVALNNAIGVWVSIPFEDGKLLYRISFVNGRRRYVFIASAPALSDPAQLPLPIVSILQAIQFRPIDVATVPPQLPSPAVTTPGASVPSVPPAPAPETIPADWQTARAGDVTLRLPAEWKASEFNTPDEGTWFMGSELFPEASFSVHRDTTVEELRRDAVLRDKRQIRVAGRPALQYVVERTDGKPETGLIIALLDERFDGSVIITAFAPSETFAELEPVFRRILSTIEGHAH